MDPDACAERYRQAVADGDAEEAEAARVDLREWRARGGFAPRGGWPVGV